MHVGASASVSQRVCVCVHVCACTCMYMCVCMCVHVCASTLWKTFVTLVRMNMNPKDKEFTRKFHPSKLSITAAKCPQWRTKWHDMLCRTADLLTLSQIYNLWHKAYTGCQNMLTPWTHTRQLWLASALSGSFRPHNNSRNRPAGACSFEGILRQVPFNQHTALPVRMFGMYTCSLQAK